MSDAVGWLGTGPSHQPSKVCSALILFNEFALCSFTYRV